MDKLQGSRPLADGDSSSNTISVYSKGSGYTDIPNSPEEHAERIREQFRERLHRNFNDYPFNKSALVELLAQMPGQSRLGYVQEVLLRRQAHIDPWITPD
jgi:patatin-like phospholipase/acyl hydrolase